jgi:error-prone DNA polymerase
VPGPRQCGEQRGGVLPGHHGGGPGPHGLLFERFLSEVRTDGRTEAPDIDVDFEMHRREEVLDYMYDSYGRAHSAITA